MKAKDVKALLQLAKALKGQLYCCDTDTEEVDTSDFDTYTRWWWEDDQAFNDRGEDKYASKRFILVFKKAHHWFIFHIATDKQVREDYIYFWDDLNHELYGDETDDYYVVSEGDFYKPATIDSYVTRHCGAGNLLTESLIKKISQFRFIIYSHSITNGWCKCDEHTPPDFFYEGLSDIEAVPFSLLSNRKKISVD